MSGKSSDPSTREERLSKLAKGWRDRLPTSVQSIQVGDREVARSEVQERLDAPLSVCEEVRELRRALAYAVQRRNQLLEAAEPLANRVERLVRVIHDEDITALRAYGLAPRKKPARHPERIAIAVIKRRNTRKRLGTLGRRQRARLTEPRLVVIGADGQPLADTGPLAPPRDEGRVTITEVRPPRPEPRQLTEADDASEP